MILATFLAVDVLEVKIETDHKFLAPTLIFDRIEAWVLLIVAKQYITSYMMPHGKGSNLEIAVAICTVDPLSNRSQKH